MPVVLGEKVLEPLERLDGDVRLGNVEDIVEGPALAEDLPEDEVEEDVIIITIIIITIVVISITLT